jgi:archaeosortase A (PGF-CTERM-specific)
MTLSESFFPLRSIELRMEAYLLILSSAAFILFLFPGSLKKYCAMVGWFGIIAYLFTQLPHYIAENNFLYPMIGVLSIPFFLLTVRLLMKEEPVSFGLTRAAAVAWLIFAPFAYIEPLGTWLIGTVTADVFWILGSLGFPAVLSAWNMILHDHFQVEIIMACTGIQSIAIMLGITGAVKTTLRQKIYAILLVVPVIYSLNVLRNVFVVMAYTDQWFPYLPEIASNGEIGYESFFWAHNVICELLALIALVAIAYGLFLLIPQLGIFADDAISTYRSEIRKVFGTDKKSSE